MVGMPQTANQDLIVENFSETLSEISVDNMDFRITWSPVEMDSCILWFRDRRVTPLFEALGKFSRFDKRAILEFIAVYATDFDLRREIEKRRFSKKVESLSPTIFQNMASLTLEQKRVAYRNLFNLSSLVQPDELEWKRRIMARRFHPDRGGDHRAMSAINEAFELLSSSPDPRRQ